MIPFRQVSGPLVYGVLAALVSAAIIFGSLSLALVEGGRPVALVSTETSTPSGFLLPSPLPPSETLPPGAPTHTPAPTSTSTPLSPSATPSCTETPPPGWIPVTVQDGDTVSSLVQAYSANLADVKRANCLSTNTLAPGSQLYLPPAPTPTLLWTVTQNLPVPTEVCGRPYGWVSYTVQPGDNLYHLSTIFGVTVRDLQVANCLGYSTNIRVGMSLWVPFLPSATPRPASPTTTLPASATWTSVPTQRPTNSATRTPSPTLPGFPTSTLTPTYTATPLPTDTPTPTPPNTSTHTPEPTATETPTPSIIIINPGTPTSTGMAHSAQLISIPLER